MDKDFDVADYEQMQKIHDLYEPARKRARCRTKNTQRSSSLPPLPSLEGVDHLISDISTEAMFTMTQEEVAKVLETPVPTIPLELNTEQPSLLQSTGPEATAPVHINPGTTPVLSQSVDKSIHEIETPITIAPAQPRPAVDINLTTTAVLPKVIPKDTSSVKIQSPVVVSKVITEQPKKTLDKYLTETKDQYAERIAKLPKPHELPADASPNTEVNYNGIAMSKKVVDTLLAQKRQEQIQLPDVHTSAKKIQEQKHQPTPEIENTEDTETYIDVELDADNNIISGQGDVQVYVPNSDKNKNKLKTSQKMELPIEISYDDNGKTTRKRKLPTAEEIEKYKIIVTIAVDTSKLKSPIPEGKQDPNFKYCSMCDKKFTRQ